MRRDTSCPWGFRAIGPRCPARSGGGESAIRFDMVRAALFTSVLLMLGAPRTWAQTPVEDLARVLRDKQVITSADYNRIVSASPGGDLTLLTTILRDKGILTNAEVAGIVPHAATPPMAAAPTVAAPPSPQPTTRTATAAGGGPQLKAYGTLLFNTFFNDQATNNIDIPLFASARAPGPTENFGATARQTRLGLSLSGEKVGNADVSGKLEIDFLGGEPAFTNGISMDLIRLRLAYARMDWQNFSLEAGQDWTIFAPLNPTSLAEFAIPAMTASGNLWIRTPQLRAEWKKNLGGGGRNLLWQLAALDPDIGDNPAVYAVARQPKAGELGRAPAIEARVAYSTPIGDKTATIGFSAHWNPAKNTGTIGGVPVVRNFESWGVAADFNVPVTKRIALSGEAFGGHALGIFSGGISQTLAPVGQPGDRGIGSRGGWTQLQINLSEKWQSDTAYGIDSPELRNLTTGSRVKNQTYMSNIMYMVSRNLTLSVEWRRFLTNYRNQLLLNNIGDQYNLAIGYTF